MSENRIKDPLGDYEAMEEKSRPSTSLVGPYLLVIVPACLAAIGFGLYAVASTLLGLIG